MELPGYKIEQELGRGGMATVFLAIQTSVERRVALKVMSPVLLVDPSFAERFTREARIAANLYHPHVVAVHDVGVHEEQPYIAMEFLSGGDLAARLSAGKVDVPLAVRVVREIAGALDYAHKKGFVHRDVKPENILFREDGTTVLTDFGIARAVNSSTQMTRTGAVIGTPQYMSPEQARGRELDGRSDIYGLGIVLYECLTGNAPFRGNDSVAVGIMHVTEPVPKLPGHLDRIQPVLDRFLAKHPDDRFQTGAEAVEELKQLEAQLITGQVPRVDVPTPQPENRGTPKPAERERPRTQVGLDETTPLPVPDTSAESARQTGSPKTGVSPTPRPDGSLRQEPTLGAMDDLSSFDRTVGQPAFTPPTPAGGRRPTPAPKKRRGKLGLVLLLLVAVAGGLGWWQRETLLEFVPDPEVKRLLERARAAYEYQHYYGDTQQYANRLYQRVLALDPDNVQARAGLDLLAETMLREFDTALGAGDAAAAREQLRRAEELAPQLAAVTAARGRLERVTLGAEVDPAASPPAQQRDEPEPPPEVPEPVAPAGPTAAELAAEGGELLTRGLLVGPGSALEQFRAALALEPGLAAAEAGVRRIGEILTADFRAAVGAGRFDDAEAAYPTLSDVLGPTASQPLRAELDGARAAVASEEAAREAARQAAANRLEDTLSRASAAFAGNRLTRPAGDNALELYQAAAELAPNDPRAREGVTRVAERLLALAEVDLERDELDAAEERIEMIASLRPSLPGLQRARNRLELYAAQSAARQLSPEDRARLERFLREADEAIGRGDLMQPPGGSAYDALKAALTMDPNSADVQAGLERLAGELLTQAQAAMTAGDLAAAAGRLAEVQQTNPFQPGFAEFQAALAERFRAAVRTAIDEGRLDEAEQLLFRAVDLQPDHEDIPALELELSIARDGGG